MSLSQIGKVAHRLGKHSEHCGEVSEDLQITQRDLVVTKTLDGLLHDFVEMIESSPDWAAMRVAKKLLCDSRRHA